MSLILCSLVLALALVLALDLELELALDLVVAVPCPLAVGSPWSQRPLGVPGWGQRDVGERYVGDVGS